jgi:hypothetical protein
MSESPITKHLRECPVYYVPCPNDMEHFILVDPADPTWEKMPPESPCKIICRVCGPAHVCNVTETWEIGYVSSDERDQGWSLNKPDRPQQRGSARR